MCCNDARIYIRIYIYTYMYVNTEDTPVEPVFSSSHIRVNTTLHVVQEIKSYTVSTKERKEGNKQKEKKKKEKQKEKQKEIKQTRNGRNNCGIICGSIDRSITFDDKAKCVSFNG